MNTPDLLTKKRLKKSIDSALLMNNSSIDYLKELLQTHDKTFSDEEKENLNNLLRYLDETLNVFFTKLIPK